MNIEYIKGPNRLTLLSLGGLLCLGFSYYMDLFQFLPIAKTKQATILETFMQNPLHFESNQGQVDNQVRYLARGDGYTIYFTPTEVVMDLNAASKASGANGVHHSTLRLQFVGANREPHVVGKELLEGKSNYLIGNDAKQWHTNIDNFSKVEYQNLYNRIDAVFYGKQRQLEYDIKIVPGANPDTVRFRIDGAKNIHLDAKGNLILTTADKQSVTMHKPIIYQYNQDTKQFVTGSFALFADNQIGFKIGAYDKTKTLIIDPTLLYSTYLGGTGRAESGLGVAADDNGSVYVTGSTNSLDFPTQNPFQATNLSGQRAGFVTKLNARGALIYSTYLGGHGDMNQGFGIAVGPQGNAYITGATNSDDFPLMNPFQSVRKGPNLNAFVTKLNAAGNGLIYSTYLGGTGFYNEGMSIALDDSGSAFIGGFTNSFDFPVQNPFQATNKGADITGFVAKLSPLGNTLDFSTYLGGTGGDDRVFGISVDCNGFAYVTGPTNSQDFPTLHPFQASPKSIGITGFVTKLNKAGSGLVYSTYLGGSGGNDAPQGIALDDKGSAYVTGFTNSSDFPVKHPFQATNNGPNFSAFVTKLAPNGSALNYSTYLGGSGGNDKSFGIAVDTKKRAYVTGQTNSMDFPLQDPIQTTNAGPDLTTFITKLNPAGKTLSFSTYFGGSGGDEKGNAIAVNNAHISPGITHVFVTGQTNSLNFPTLNAFQPNNLGTITGYVAKLSS